MIYCFYLLLIGLLLYGLYRLKSAMGINLSHRHHAQDFLKLPIRAIRYPETRRSLRRYTQLNRHNPLPHWMSRKWRAGRSRLSRLFSQIWP